MMTTRTRPADARARRCRDCSANPGETHDPGCDAEQCALCGGQSISCDCVYTVNGIDPATLETARPDLWEHGATPEMAARFVEEEAKVGGPLPWTGVSYGVADCIELGWWAKPAPPPVGWESCPAGTVGAVPDLNRYARACGGREPGFRWDPAARKLARVQ